ncbi:MAG: hypothetical protein EXR77_03725 [Myxococcales bacterium]|nr:hypothetical protein [Myxococcales bacterium]
MANESEEGATGDSALEAPDSMDRVTPLRRVDRVGMSMIAMQRDPPAPKPAKPEREGISLTLKPYSLASSSRRMSTMTDLTSQSNPLDSKDIAKVRNSHFSARPQSVTEVAAKKVHPAGKDEPKT